MAYTKKMRILNEEKEKKKKTSSPAKTASKKETAPGQRLKKVRPEMFKKLQMTLYLHQWVKDALDEQVEAGVFDKLSQAIEVAIVRHYQLQKPQRPKKV